MSDVTDPPVVRLEVVEGQPEPIAREINPAALRELGQRLKQTFEEYASDRKQVEQKWLRNLRQYKGIYDPELEKKLPANRSRAYPRVTRVKCISILSRLMNLMFPGNEKNWELKASPSPDMSPEDVMEAVHKAMQKAAEQGVENEEINEDMIDHAVQNLATERANRLSLMIEDQLEEIGGDQTQDFVRLNREVLQSGIRYGMGVLRGPYVRETNKTVWRIDPETRQPVALQQVTYKPQYEVVSVWDFYPDMASKRLGLMDGYFTRMVMARSQLRRLADRDDFFGETIKSYIKNHPGGNYKSQGFESELRSLDVKANVNEDKVQNGRFELQVWNGSVSARTLLDAGVDIPDKYEADDVQAEVWLLDGHVIKADMDPWTKIGADVKTIHTFIFDEDDSNPTGAGVPDVMRDSQMAICAATRMMLDNASVVCGPQVEVNVDLMTPDQDVTSLEAYKIWYREGTGPDANVPALRNIVINSYIPELMSIVDKFMQFADTETFVGPATGGDMSQGPSEPMRTAAGASMIRADAALPFKDVVRNFDCFTQSVINSLVAFNRKFNPQAGLEGDYDVVARGATSLIAKEVRGMQVDNLAATMTPEEMDHVDERRLVEARFNVRDLSNMLLTPDEVKRKRDKREEMAAARDEEQQEMMRAEIRKTLSEAFKNVTQGQKNTAQADAAAFKAVMDLMEKDNEANAALAGGGAPASAPAQIEQR